MTARQQALEAYNTAMEYVKTLDGITQYRLRRLTERHRTTYSVNCPDCLVDNITTPMTIDMCIPPENPDPNDEVIGMGVCVRCETCGHKGHFVIESEEPEGMEVEKEFRSKQRKRRRKRQ